MLCGSVRSSLVRSSITSRLPQCLWPQNLIKTDHVVLQDHVTSYNIVYIHCNNVYAYQNWQGGDIGLSITRPFEHVILQGHMTHWIPYISTTTLTTATKVVRLATYNVELLSKNYSIPWSRVLAKVTWHIKYVMSLLKGLWPLHLARWWLTMIGFHS